MNNMQITKIIVLLLCAGLWVSCGNKEKKQENFRYFRNYQATFRDLNDKHVSAARRWGIKPIQSDEELEKQMKKLEKITSCRWYDIDDLTHSLPYLVPRAAKLLETIGRNFRDSLDSKGLPDRKIIVTSVLRTNSGVKRLRKKNLNASANSAHMFGTTFDIAYARYVKGKEEERDKLKTVLAEVLRDLMEDKKCYVRYEFKQGCFHITVR